MREKLLLFCGVVCIVLVFLEFVGGCDSGVTLSGKCEYKEIARIKSPDGLVEAVIVRGDAGATTSTVTCIYLVPVSGKINTPSDEKLLFAGDHLKNFNVIWKEAKLLEIHYEEARITSFMNFWQSHDIQNFHYTVEVKLVPERADFSLPLADRTW